LEGKRKYYREQLGAFVPAVEAAARSWTRRILSRQSPLLARLSFAAHYQAERLHDASLELRKKARTFVLPVLTSEEHAEITNKSSTALVNTDSELTTDRMIIWHFTTAVSAGVATLGLVKRPNLTKFSLAWATTQKGWVESALDVAMNAIMVLDLVGGPIGAEI